MSKAWLSIVGIGEDGLAGLGQSARDALDEATTVVGGKRHLAMLGKDTRPQITWGSPFKSNMAKIGKLKGQKVCVLASGDPLTFGVGATLIKAFGADQCMVFPHPSSFSLAAARMGWSQAGVEMLTLHSRPLANLNRYLRSGARLLALTNDGKSPIEVARLLVAQGYGDTRMTVLSHLGGPKEKQQAGIARTWKGKSPDLNVIALECVADRGKSHRNRLAGLADSLYEHDGQLTKQDVRAVTLAALTPAPDDVLWDVGAGAGSIAIEFLRAESNATAFAIEQNKKRLKNIKTNADNLGVPALNIIAGQAPAALKDLTRPSVIFVGGGVGDVKILQTCWRALKPGGRFVANSVSIEGETRLFDMMRRHGGSLTQIAVSHMDTIGDLHAWRAMRPVVQYRAIKL
jgi:precorrin-6B C5,15-methyltransferase / cobalt-precorrin-6B C5,C15-methyltransferase